MPEALQFHRDGDCLWVVPRAIHTDLEATPEAVALRAELQREDTRQVIVDLGEIPYFGSTVLEFIVLLWRRVARRGGRLVLYRPSPIGREVLGFSRLDRLWPVTDSREEALRMVRQRDEEDAAVE